MKLVFYSSTITMMHGLIYIRFTLMFYNQAKFVAYILYHYRLLMGRILSSETSCGSFYYQRIFISQGLCIRNC